MADFRRLTENMLASPQITPADVHAAREHGVTLIINNRPDGESPEEPQGPEIEAAAREAGITYLYIPVTHAGFSLPQIDEMAQAIDAAEGQVLAYCRSGTRSTLLWAMAGAKLGMEPDTIAACASQAGYDVEIVRPTIDLLAQGANPEDTLSD